MYSADVRSRVRGDQGRPHLVIAFAQRRLRLDDKMGHTALWDEQRCVFNEALMFQGVVETHQDVWFDRWAFTDLIAAPCARPDLGMAWARGHAERRTPYDYAGALSVPLRADWQSEHALYCAEKETLALMRAGLVLFADHTRGVHPHDLWRACAVFAQLRADH